jgi:hypothetical protein
MMTALHLLPGRTRVIARCTEPMLDGTVTLFSGNLVSVGPLFATTGRRSRS